MPEAHPDTQQVIQENREHTLLMQEPIEFIVGGLLAFPVVGHHFQRKVSKEQAAFFWSRSGFAHRRFG